MVSRNGLHLRDRHAARRGRRIGRTTTVLLVCLAIPVALLGTGGCRQETPASGAIAWEEVTTGLQMAAVALRDTLTGQVPVHLLRVDPRRYRLRLRTASEDSVPQPRTAREWCRREGAVAAVNAGMYGADGLTSVGLLRKRGHANNPHLGRQRMVLLLDPADPADPPVRLVDRTCEDLVSLQARYRAHLQSIRMVGCDRRIVWRPGGRRHPVTAIGTDDRWRVLLIHCGVPVDPHDLLERLLALPIGLQRVMYLEGGRPGQLCVAANGREWEFSARLGGVELPPPPIPNVILVVPKESRRGA